MKTEKIIEKITGLLGEIINSNVEYFQTEDSFKVRPDYGYAKFYLDWIDGSYDMSLQGLIHYIMYEEGIYSQFLNHRQYADLEKVIKEFPEAIYSPDSEDEDYETLQYEILDRIYAESIEFVGRRLIELGFDVKETFSEYLVQYE